MRRFAVMAALLATLTLAACSDASPDATAGSVAPGSIESITIGTSDTLAPSLTFPLTDSYVEAQGEVIWKGEGAALENNQPLLLDVYGVSLADGSPVINSYDGLPRPYVLAREVLGDELYELLIDARVGTRVLLVAPAPGQSSATPSVVLVVDVLSDRAIGTQIPQVAGLPHVIVGETGEPSITIPSDAQEPAEPQVATLIQGDGPQVKPGSYISTNYKAVHWDGSEFESTWPSNTAPFETQVGTGQLPLALDAALLDQTAGSQILVVAPPAYGYPDEGTLVFVVDILDVWNADS